MLLHWLMLTANGAVIDRHLLGSWAAGWPSYLLSLMLLVPGAHALVLLSEGAMRQRFAAAWAASAQRGASSTGACVKTTRRSSSSGAAAAGSDGNTRQPVVQCAAEAARDALAAGAGPPVQQGEQQRARQEEQVPAPQPTPHQHLQGVSDLGQRSDAAAPPRTAQQAQQARQRARQLERQAALQFAARQACYRRFSQSSSQGASEQPAASSEHARGSSEAQAPVPPLQPADAFPEAWLSELADSLVKARASSGQQGHKPSWLLQRRPGLGT
jgi:hypothetical protein